MSKPKNRKDENKNILNSSPFKIVQGIHDDLPEHEKIIVNQLEDEFSLQVLVEAESYYQLGAYRMAVKMLEAYTKIYHHNPTAWNRLGTAYSEIDEDVKAIGCFQKAYEMSPEDRDFLLNYAGTLSQLSKTEEAQAILAKHFSQFPENKLYMYFHWYEGEYPMNLIKYAWKNKSKFRMKVVNEKPLVNGKSNDEGQS